MLITRPAADAAATAERVRRLGFEPVVAPLLEVVPGRIDSPPGIDAIVVTSGNALEAIGTLAHVPLLAVGDATAAKARAAGFTRVESAGGDAADLAALVSRHVPQGSHILFPTVLGEGAALEASLHAAGYAVHRKLAYAIHPVHKLPRPAIEALGSDRLRAALFLSARTANAFVRLLPPGLWPHLAGVEALAIGAPAASELALLPWRRVRVSLAPTLDQVLALL